MEAKPIHDGFLYEVFVKKTTLQWHRYVDDILLCARYCAKKCRCRTLQRRCKYCIAFIVTVCTFVMCILCLYFFAIVIHLFKLHTLSYIHIILYGN